MNHDDNATIPPEYLLLHFWATLPAFSRVGLASRALWLLMAMRQQTPAPTPMSMPEIGALGGLDKLETGMLVAELMVAQLVEMHGHVMLNPCFTVIPIPGMEEAPVDSGDTIPQSPHYH